MLRYATKTKKLFRTLPKLLINLPKLLINQTD